MSLASSARPAPSSTRSRPMTASSPAVDPGETFNVECAINVNDGTIRHVGQQLTPADVTLPFVNGATGPIEVRGAKPGDMLTVEILDMKLDGLGFTLALARHRHLSRLGAAARSSASQTQVVEVKDGLVHWNDTLKLPVRPMIGVIGVAPVHGAVLTVDNGTAWRQSRRPGDHHRQHGDAAGQPGRRASVPGRLPRHPGRRRMQRHGGDRDRGRRSTVQVSLAGAGTAELAPDRDADALSARSAAPGRSRTRCGSRSRR